MVPARSTSSASDGPTLASLVCASSSSRKCLPASCASAKSTVSFATLDSGKLPPRRFKKASTSLRHLSRLTPTNATSGVVAASSDKSTRRPNSEWQYIAHSTTTETGRGSVGGAVPLTKSSVSKAGHALPSNASSAHVRTLSGGRAAFSVSLASEAAAAAAAATAGSASPPTAAGLTAGGAGDRSGGGGSNAASLGWTRSRRISAVTEGYLSQKRALTYSKLPCSMRETSVTRQRSAIESSSPPANPPFPRAAIRPSTNAKARAITVASYSSRSACFRAGAEAWGARLRTSCKVSTTSSTASCTSGSVGYSAASRPANRSCAID
mmetsp:Transcript_30001/g.89771  ORF Transcript_30001/g.89771 Transcript_30001/m.89771 type:complete len:324 (+) Transcript_30001:366-1337(+)